MRVVITGLDEVYAKLEKVKNVHEAVLEGIREVLEEASNIVRQAYAMQGGDNTDFYTEINMQPTGGTLRIYGDDVGFLEFGAGTTVATSDVFASEVDYEVYSGSWSVQDSGQFAKHGYWYYKHNVRYQYLFPTRGAEKALNHILNTLEKKIEEKISQWID